MIKILLLLFLIGHFLADFYFQSNKLAISKDHLFSKLLLHCLIYLITVIVVILPVFSIELAFTAIIVAIVHFLIDLTKYLLKKKQIIHDKYGHATFLLDQGLHIITIVVVVGVVYRQSVPISYTNWVDSIFGQLLSDDQLILSWLLIILLIIKPVSILIKQVLYNYRPSNADESDGYPNAGALIGVLERSIILLLLSVNQYSAIGFVLTAKSIARYNKIAEDPKFSEYYLLGTLLSALLVILAYVIIF
ncbi:DUF3307 domain-containing protein [Amphibacillus indicireducens]|uniref:DUF3307 domain-containing protein n=1 Tax=Amphibacillus indicireducens TaxID=1076330 RepID=A0ABP7VA97_9BACI